MGTIYFICIFICVLFVYLHFVNELKKSNDVTIYETEYLTNTNLQETCELKQPFICKLNDFKSSSISNNSSTELKVKDCTSKNTNEYIMLSYSSFNKLIENDKKGRYYTEKNSMLCNELLHKDFQKLNKYLRPSFTLQSTNDYIYGSKNSFIPLKYHSFSRYFLYVESGYVRVKMTPWKYGQYMNVQTDYEDFSQSSPINIWNPQPEYVDVIKNSHFIEFTVKEGSFLYIPCYWLYSIKFEGNPRLYGISYATGMNMIVNIKMYCIHLLHKLNSDTSLLKKLDNKEVNDEIKVEDEISAPLNNEQGEIIVNL